MTRKEIEKILEQNDSTILSFKDRGPWGDNKYRGNCSGYIQAFLIWKYQVQRMAELFAGSGTGYDVCKDMGIGYFGLAPDGVARIVEIPSLYKLSIISSSQPRLYFPSSGSSTAQEKIPTDTVLIWAFLKYSMSFFRMSGRSSHCSGL